MNFRYALAVVAAFSLSSAACGDDTPDPDAGMTDTDAGTNPDGGNGPADSGTAADLNTPTRILVFLEGKTLRMEGTNIPSHPNGFTEDLDFGAATQCYNQTTITVSGGNFSITSIAGTLVGAAPNTMCDRDMPGATIGPFASNTITINNVNAPRADCFDVQLDFQGFSQVGRAKFAPDLSEVWMELYFAANSPSGHTCMDGAVGPQTGAVTQTIPGVGVLPFTGDAVQKYVIE
jgi:hypothetical protein